MGQKKILQSQCMFPLELPSTPLEKEITEVLGGWYHVVKLYGGFKRTKGIIHSDNVTIVGDSQTMYFFNEEGKMFLREKEFLPLNDLKRLNSDVIIGCTEQGLILYKNESFTRLEIQVEGHDLIKSRCLFIYKNKLIVGDDEQVWMIDLKDLSISSPIKIKAIRIEVFQDKIYITHELGVSIFDGEKLELVIDQPVRSVRFDSKGHAWAATSQGIKLFDSSFHYMGMIKFPESVSDLTFNDSKVMVITDTGLYWIEM